ncbi:MAG: hypothetical protein HQM09_03810 [Candidatus Riflebacteria bacterium]|nr:hypothetical protein [Candidatus Riflebacteria bacterium]
MVVLVLGLFLTGVMNLMTTVMGNFTKQEESVVCAGEASLLMSQLSRDFERLVNRGSVPGNFPDKFSQAKMAAIGNPPDLFSFTILDTDLKKVEYSYNKDEKSLTRNYDGHVIAMAKGRVASFAFYWQVLTPDALVRSYPPEPPDTTVPNAPSDGKVTRCWGKFAITIESPKSNAAGIKYVRQEYNFMLFPVRFNSELQSICSE